MLGEDVERGSVPHDLELLSGLVRDISFRNARDYFGLALVD
jgi:glucuronate isomerase